MRLQWPARDDGNGDVDVMTGSPKHVAVKRQTNGVVVEELRLRCDCAVLLEQEHTPQAIVVSDVQQSAKPVEGPACKATPHVVLEA